MKKMNIFNKFIHTNIFAIISIVSILIFSMTMFITLDAEGNMEKRNKIYTTVEIEAGDSLWTVARDYYSDEYSDYNELIEEIKDINNMIDDNVKRGCYIIVPQYVD